MKILSFTGTQNKGHSPVLKDRCGVSAAVAGFGAADAFGAVFFDALRGGM